MKGIFTFLALTLVLPTSAWCQSAEERLLEAFKETLAEEKAPTEEPAPARIIRVAQPAATPTPVSNEDTPTTISSPPAKVPRPTPRPTQIQSSKSASAAPAQARSLADRQEASRYNDCAKTPNEFFDSAALQTLLEQKLEVENAFELFDKVFVGNKVGFRLDIFSGENIEYIEVPSQNRRKVTGICARDVFIGDKVSKRIYLKVANADKGFDTVEFTPVSSPQSSNPEYQILVLKGGFDVAQDYTSQMLSQEDYARIGHPRPQQNSQPFSRTSRRVGGLF